MTDMLRPVPIDLEPKRKNRFVMEFPADLGFSEWMVQSAGRPKVDITETEIPFMNVSTWVAGRSTWQTLNITFIDAIGPSTSQKVMEWVRQCIEHSTGAMGYASQYKKNIVLKALDPAGIAVEKWVLYGCFITNADFGDLDYASADLANVTITVRFDRAILEY
jgi:hypothetical protein